MWYKLGQFVLKFRIPLLILLAAITVFMGWHATQVRLNYEFANSVPLDNPKYLQYQEFKSRFGNDGNVLVLGVNDQQFFTPAHFSAYKNMLKEIKQVKGVESILSVPSAVNLVKADSSEQLTAKPIFPDSALTQPMLDSGRLIFENLLFYRGLLHNPDSSAYLAGITVNKKMFDSAVRTQVVNQILAAVGKYETATKVEVKRSGLPLIRTIVADRIRNEMNYFLLGSLLLATFTLLLFFRSISATIISLAVVIMGVLWSLGILHLLGYKISILTALIPPLIIVIGIPNCIYFLNKYHMSWEKSRHSASDGMPAGEIKRRALLEMVNKMGIVTLFCNIAAAVGFAVFALTKSVILKEFGMVAGINIMLLFIISLIFIPAMLSFLKPPKARHTKYLRNRFLENLLVKVEFWVLKRKPLVYGLTAAVVLFSILGMMRLKSVGYIVDDLPKKDKIYTDLKWFERTFGGVMPLEVVVDTKKKGGITRSLATMQKIDEFSAYIDSLPECARPLTLVEGLKFAKQAYYDGDSTSYSMPNEFDLAFLQPYLKGKSGDSTSQLSKLTKSFMDSTRQRARISINMADIGTARLPHLMDSLQARSAAIFDTAYNLTFTGGSVTFLEGSRFIINGLKESIMWAFLLIAICMLFLFRSFRILICSLIPNIIPLVITAGVMGWAGVPIKPSTVLIFSVALGIAIDITIRFLVNYKQELPTHNYNILETITSTIRHTGISIIYTSLVLVAGFVIFMFSSFGGTFGLGWLTSFTLLTATFTNLVFLPVIMLGLMKKKIIQQPVVTNND